MSYKEAAMSVPFWLHINPSIDLIFLFAVYQLYIIPPEKVVKETTANDMRIYGTCCLLLMALVVFVGVK